MPKDEDGYCICCGHKGSDCDCSEELSNSAYFHCKKHCWAPAAVEEEEEEEEEEEDDEEYISPEMSGELDPDVMGPVSWYTHDRLPWE